MGERDHRISRNRSMSRRQRRGGAVLSAKIIEISWAQKHLSNTRHHKSGTVWPLLAESLPRLLASLKRCSSICDRLNTLGRIMFNYFSRMFQQARAQACRRAHYRCEIPTCRSSVDLHVHHIQALWQRPDLAYDPLNLIVLCVRHHALEHGYAIAPPQWWHAPTRAANDDQFELPLNAVQDLTADG